MPTAIETATLHADVSKLGRELRKRGDRPMARAARDRAYMLSHTLQTKLNAEKALERATKAHEAEVQRAKGFIAAMTPRSNDGGE